MKNFDKIERRLSGKMTEEERSAFDRELSENEDLAREYELQSQEEDLLDIAVEEDLLAQIKDIRSTQSTNVAEEPPAKVRPLFPWRRVLSIAAGVALILSTFYILRPGGQQHSSPLALAQSTYTQYPPNFSGSKATDTDGDALAENIHRLKGDTKDVQLAIDYFEKNRELLFEVDYYLGHAYWRLRDYPKADDFFRDFLSRAGTEHRLSPYAQFYKALSLLASGKPDKARQYIDSIKDGHLFQRQLEEVANKI